MLIGYIRLPAQDQNPDLERIQLEELTAVGCQKIIKEKASGAQRDRPELQAILATIRKRDTLVVWRLDCLAHSLRQLLETIEELSMRDVGFRSLSEALDTTKPGGYLLFRLACALAEFERTAVRERWRVGVKDAHKEGRFRGGRPRALSEEDLTTAHALLQNSDNTFVDVAERLNVSLPTLYRYLPGGHSQVLFRETEETEKTGIMTHGSSPPAAFY